MPDHENSDDPANYEAMRERNPGTSMRPWFVDVYERLAKQEVRLDIHEASVRSFNESISARFDRIEKNAASIDEKLDRILTYFRVGKWGVGAAWAVISLAIITFGMQFIAWLFGKH